MELTQEKKEKHMVEEKEYLNKHQKNFDEQWYKYGDAVKFLLQACDNKDRKILDLNKKVKEIQEKIDIIK